MCAALPLRELWVGESFALGRKREGTVPRLTEIGRSLGYTVGTLATLVINGERVSSSRVRAMLLAGDVAGVEHLLGRHFTLYSTVVEGDHRGRTIGFPTANLAIHENHALPADGVYACYAYVDGQARPAVTNIGLRPTFGELRRTVETYLLDWSGNLYGQTIRVAFVHRLRGERKFDGVDALVAQITRDVEQARALLTDER
jgi:riboflavin kinase/FMN adenylyltransferase